MAYFPLFIDLWGQEILVVGGGPIAARRIRVLREFGCRILAVAPEAVTDIKEMEKEMPETVRSRERMRRPILWEWMAVP